MKKLIQTLLIGAIAILFSASVLAEVQSLRGDNDLDKSAKPFKKHKQIKVKGGIERSFELQPPMIPHSIEKDKITLRANTCMKCHSKENHVREKAPAIGISHYLDRNGKTLDKPSARRYFCNQCHTPQLNVDPLIENDFAGN